MHLLCALLRNFPVPIMQQICELLHPSHSSSNKPCCRIFFSTLNCSYKGNHLTLLVGESYSPDVHSSQNKAKKAALHPCCPNTPFLIKHEITKLTAEQTKQVLSVTASITICANKLQTLMEGHYLQLQAQVSCFWQPTNIPSKNLLLIPKKHNALPEFRNIIQFRKFICLHAYRFYVCIHSFHNLLIFFLLDCAIDILHMFTFTTDISKVSSRFLCQILQHSITDKSQA